MANPQYGDMKPGAVHEGYAGMQRMDVSRPDVDSSEEIIWTQVPLNDERWTRSLPKYPKQGAMPAPQAISGAAAGPPPYAMPLQPSPRNGKAHSAYEQQLHRLMLGQEILRVPQEEEKQPPAQPLLQPVVAPMNPSPPQRSPHPSPPREPVVQVPQDDFKCIVCLDLHEVLLSDRSCGALLCESCASKVRTCPNCRAPAAFERNAYLDRLMSNIEMRCRCGATLTKREIPRHKDSCPMEMTACPAMSCRDVRAMSKGDLIKHFQDIHFEEFMTAFVRQYPSVFP